LTDNDIDAEAEAKTELAPILDFPVLHPISVPVANVPSCHPMVNNVLALDHTITVAPNLITISAVPTAAATEPDVTNVTLSSSRNTIREVISSLSTPICHYSLQLPPYSKVQIALSWVCLPRLKIQQTAREGLY
jgi:hypothetical protein